MTTSADIAPVSGAFQPTVSGTSGAVTRDPRLDVFRGLAMFIILIAHAPGNFFSNYIPARYGFSDAAEIFVFCSGMASAIAFGRVYDRAGWYIGTARVGFRIWQVYWGHIGVFLVIAATMYGLNTSGLFTETGLYEKNYITSLNLQRFFDETGPQLLGLLTLTYVPNFFDILPMYIVLLAMMPIVMLLHKISPWAVLIVLGGLWLSTQLGRSEFDGNPIADTFGLFGLPAEPWSDRRWFFNPFGWQIIFYTGFALMRGWIPQPPVNRLLIAIAYAIVVLSIPIARWWIRRDYPVLVDLWDSLAPFRPKSEEGILRYVHFLALAYLAWAAAGVGGHRLLPRKGGIGARIWNGALKVITKVGQQSLAVFMFSMLMARLMGVAIDIWGKEESLWYWSNFGTVWIVNIIGAASIIAVAYIAAWFKSQPWRRREAHK